MELSPALGLMVVFLLVLANGFFVATEFAIVAVRRSRLEELVQERRAGAAAARDVVGHLDAYIAATQFGITLASLALGWIGEPALAHLVEPAFAVVGGRLRTGGRARRRDRRRLRGDHRAAHRDWRTGAEGVGAAAARGTSLWVARPIQLFHAVFKWPITALNAVGNGTLRLFGLAAASGHEMVHSVEELRLLVTGMQKAGVVDVVEARIAQRAFAFGELTAGALMTPRTEMEAVPVTATLEELLRLAETTRHSRLPVFEGSPDNVVGVLHVRELFKHRNTAPEAFALRTLTRPPVIVPETKYAADVLEEMRHESVPPGRGHRRVRRHRRDRGAA